MSQILKIQLHDATFAAIVREAQEKQSTPDAIVAESVEKAFGGRGSTPIDPAEARRRFERHLGAVDLGYPTGVDNEAIDADLASEYRSTHEDA